MYRNYISADTEFTSLNMGDKLEFKMYLLH